MIFKGVWFLRLMGLEMKCLQGTCLWASAWCILLALMILCLNDEYKIHASLLDLRSSSFLFWAWVRAVFLYCKIIMRRFQYVRLGQRLRAVMIIWNWQKAIIKAPVIYDSVWTVSTVPLFVFSHTFVFTHSPQEALGKTCTWNIVTHIHSIFIELHYLDHARAEWLAGSSICWSCYSIYKKLKFIYKMTCIWVIFLTVK